MPSGAEALVILILLVLLAIGALYGVIRLALRHERRH